MVADETSVCGSYGGKIIPCIMTTNSPSYAASALHNHKVNTTYQASKHVYNERIKILVLHATDQSFAVSLAQLTGQHKERLVSAHYLVADTASNDDTCIYQIVDEQHRAWHAGAGYWNGYQDVNSVSIGIELVNLDGNKHAYPESQIDATTELLLVLINKYQIEPCNIIAHSDLAPSRKVDPGACFPWQELHQKGIGAWPDESDVQECMQKYINTSLPAWSTIYKQFERYGYAIDDTNVRLVISAFQRHFRPASIDGMLDNETYAILIALLKKYKRHSDIPV